MDIREEVKKARAYNALTGIEAWANLMKRQLEDRDMSGATYQQGLSFIWEAIAATSPLVNQPPYLEMLSTLVNEFGLATPYNIPQTASSKAIHIANPDDSLEDNDYHKLMLQRMEDATGYTVSPESNRFPFKDTHVFTIHVSPLYDVEWVKDKEWIRDS